jgi:hypothetical protein
VPGGGDEGGLHVILIFNLLLLWIDKYKNSFAGYNIIPKHKYCVKQKNN